MAEYRVKKIAELFNATILVLKTIEQNGRQTLQ
jgi:hypothetical protein